MSRKPPPPRGLPKPGSAGAPRPGTVKPATSKTTVLKPPSCPMAADKLRKMKKQQLAKAPPKIYENPAFSIPLKEVQTNPLLAEKDKQKTIRRNKPENEDTKGLKNVILSLKDSPDVTVGEFIALVAPYTGDNGDVLRAVMTNDMNSFRQMTRKIYDTMMQDVSDVMTNQHIQLREYEQERTTLYTEKMMRAINEIYGMAPNFDFEAYYEDKENYLNSLFPLPRLIQADSDEAEMHRRQQAFHRLNWLRTEGDRLSAENERLQQRLRELKKEQFDEIKGAERREKEAEAKREQLEAQEAAVQKQLEALTDSVEKTMIDTEAAMRVAADEANISATATSSKADLKKRTKKTRRGWGSDVAAEIDEKAIEGNMIADAGEVDLGNLAGAIKKVRSKVSRTRMQTPERGTPTTKEKSPFHFSPIKTPPGKPPPSDQKSPFHFSPIKTPPEIRLQAARSFTARATETPVSPSQLHTTRLRTEKVTVRHLGPQPKGLLVPPSAGASRTPQGLQKPTGGDDATPIYQTVQATTPGAPARHGPMRAQKPAHSKFDAGQPSRPEDSRRGRAAAPRDTWGGYG